MNPHPTEEVRYINENPKRFEGSELDSQEQKEPDKVKDNKSVETATQGIYKHPDAVTAT
jgi:hypothetical protein